MRLRSREGEHPDRGGGGLMSMQFSPTKARRTQSARGRGPSGDGLEEGLLLSGPATLFAPPLPPQPFVDYPAPRNSHYSQSTLPNGRMPDGSASPGAHCKVYDNLRVAGMNECRTAYGTVRRGCGASVVKSVPRAPLELTAPHCA
eukprot:507963-Pyramimonas_sp.AAC.1